MPISQAEREKEIRELESFRDEFRKYGDLVLKVKNRRALNKNETIEFERLYAELPQKYGGLKEIIEKYAGSAVLPLQGGKCEYEVFTSSFNFTPFSTGSLLALVNKAIITLGIAIGKLRSLPEAYVEAQDMETTQSPKALIAHGGQSACLRKLCDFLKALGVEPIVAEWKESEGRWTERHVDKLMEESDCYIVLAEYGNIVDLKTGAKHPRLNVIDELARSREKRSDRIVLLLQKGVSLPSNVSGIVYEHFTKQNMEKAFIKVARELRAFGLIKATKECK
jgi:predicted nucleotide-binding protein